MMVSASLPTTTPPPLSSSSTTGTATNGSAHICPRCHQAYKPGAKFCNSCGYQITPNTTSPDPDTSSLLPQTDPLSHLQPGSLLNEKYKILKEIGAGGMGAVYLADDTVLKRQVVIKALLSDDDSDLVAQSVKEREFLAAIKHANIVSIYDFITIGHKGYIVMEYVHGQTLEEMLQEHHAPLSVPEAIRAILGILPAFTYLAKLGLVYCDFKPQNVMVEQLKDGTNIVKLIDLGTVIRYEPRPKDVYGTHGFYAPEAVKSPSAQTDLYSLCRTLAYLVSFMDLGSPIFGMPSIEDYRVFSEYPALYRLLVKGTHSKPAQRFQSAEELAAQLTGVLRQIVGGKPGEPVGSNLFVPGILTTTGRLGLRGEATLDENDAAIDLLRYGDQALRAGNYSSAQNFYQQAARNNQKSIDAHLRLVEVHIDREEYNLALSEITMAQHLTPEHWKLHWYMGRLLEGQGRYHEAAEHYQELLAQLPGELPPLQALARVHNRMQDYQNAVGLYEMVLKADPGNTDALLGAADSLFSLSRWDDAAQLLSSVNEAAARYVDAQLLLIDLYLTRMQPLLDRNILRAAEVVTTLEGRTEDSRYYLTRGDVYRAAWRLAKKHAFSAGTHIAGVADCQPRTLGHMAEQGYREYLRRNANPPNREQTVRHKLEVAPWHFW
jgi:serine/threonine-protein kinase PknG